MLLGFDPFPLAHQALHVRNCGLVRLWFYFMESVVPLALSLAEGWGRHVGGKCFLRVGVILLIVGFLIGSGICPDFRVARCPEVALLHESCEGFVIGRLCSTFCRSSYLRMTLGLLGHMVR